MSFKLDQTKEAPRADWWITDSRGRKIGYMWPEDMHAIIESIWGPKQGIKEFHRYAGLNRATVERYCNGYAAIPKHIALMVLLVQREAIVRPKKYKHVRPYKWLPSTDADWLPHYNSKYHPNRHPSWQHDDDM